MLCLWRCCFLLSLTCSSGVPLRKGSTEEEDGDDFWLPKFNSTFTFPLGDSSGQGGKEAGKDSDSSEIVQARVHVRVQARFDAGMLHMAGFNRVEARRCFEAAAVLDDSCALCKWGVAYSCGPNPGEGEEGG